MEISTSAPMAPDVRVNATVLSPFNLALRTACRQFSEEPLVERLMRTSPLRPAASFRLSGMEFLPDS